MLFLCYFYCILMICRIACLSNSKPRMFADDTDLTLQIITSPKLNANSI